MCMDSESNMDDVSQYNVARWNALAEANALFTRPLLDLDADSARQRVDPEGLLGEVSGKAVLLLAGGGGQQSAAFALLGANVTVLDISEKQLERDQLAAAHYGFAVKTYQGDMRDLSPVGDTTFDMVYQPYSLNFVPDARQVFAGVAAVLRPGGLYHFMCANPFASGLTEHSWNGEGYSLHQPYQQGTKLVYQDSDWVYDRAKDGQIQGPQEFRQTLSTVLNGLVEQKFTLLHMKEIVADAVDLNAEPGTWDHFTAIMPPWLAFWTIYQPDMTG